MQQRTMLELRKMIIQLRRWADANPIIEGVAVFGFYAGSPSKKGPSELDLFVLPETSDQLLIDRMQKAPPEDREDARLNMIIERSDEWGQQLKRRLNLNFEVSVKYHEPTKQKTLGHVRKYHLGVYDRNGKLTELLK